MRRDEPLDRDAAANRGEVAGTVSGVAEMATTTSTGASTT
jgi:hypothetical protein